MLARTFTSAVTGIDAVTVTIEVNESRGVQFALRAWVEGFKGVLVPVKNDREAAASRFLSARQTSMMKIFPMYAFRKMLR